MTKKLFFELLIPTSHLASATLTDVKVHVALRLRANFKILYPLQTELSELEAELNERGVPESEKDEERKIWGNESFAQASEVHIFTEEQFENMKNELLNGQPLDIWVSKLLSAQENLKNVE